MFSGSKPETNMTVGARIRAARSERRMTLSALARASGLTKGFVSQVESGTSGVSLASLERIASALKLPLAALMASETDPSAKVVPEPVQEPALIATHNLYQETSGLAKISVEQTGTHFVASVPPYTMLSNPFAVQSSNGSQAIIVVLQGSIRVRYASHELRASSGEVASWDSAQPYSLENRAPTSTRLLIFLPEGAPLPALTRLPDPYSSPTRADYSPALQGPMRLVEMRARRQAERRR
jgi:transcriptional regulator with XRE-family HTH domain